MEATSCSASSLCDLTGCSRHPWVGVTDGTQHSWVDGRSGRVKALKCAQCIQARARIRTLDDHGDCIECLGGSKPAKRPGGKAGHRVIGVGSGHAQSVDKFRAHL
jgi:hypothetical protein